MASGIRGVPLEEVLLWLHDRCGEFVAAQVLVERGDSRAEVMTADGILRHWSDSAHHEASGSSSALPREDVMGLYELGEERQASIDLSQLPAVVPGAFAADEMTIAINEVVWLTVVVIER